MATPTKPRVLHVITVYNGRPFVERAIKSAVSMNQADAHIDVLVLDDASPEPGWSAELEKICRHLGARYYRTPRNLGIPRNVSLGLMTAIEKNYDFVTINNSDVIFPQNLIGSMVEACRADRVGSVTAWSNNVSIYSISNRDPDRFLASQEVVNFVSDNFAEKYRAKIIDVPAGISFCIMMPINVVKDVGVMDPIFGRGYCEETDWSLRSLQKGYRICLAPGVFVYHQGRGSNLAAGLVSGAHTTVPENEAIIDMRFPNFRNQCRQFEQSGVMDRLKAESVDYLLNSVARKHGFAIFPGWKPTPAAALAAGLAVEVMPDGYSPTLRYSYAGFEQTWPIEGGDAIINSIKRFGEEHLVYNAFDMAVAHEAKALYPQTVW